MNITKKMMEAKLLQIAKFEEDYGTDHGQTNVYACLLYTSDAADE